MGWKTVKEHYRIDHSVHVTDEGMCIGSPFVHDLIVINDEGGLKLSSVVRRTGNDKLSRYVREMESDPGKLQWLMREADTFEVSVTVYTYVGGEIVERQCEEPGWPNCTHDGQMMYGNTFSTDKSKIVRRAKEEASIGIRWSRETVEDLRKQLSKARERVTKCVSELKKLNVDYPEGQELP